MSLETSLGCLAGKGRSEKGGVLSDSLFSALSTSIPYMMSSLHSQILPPKQTCKSSEEALDSNMPDADGDANGETSHDSAEKEQQDSESKGASLESPCCLLNFI